MIRFAASAFAIFALAAPALAVEFEADERGQIHFNMPSNNVDCVYTPAGGTDNYETESGEAEKQITAFTPSGKQTENTVSYKIVKGQESPAPAPRGPLQLRNNRHE